MQYDSLINKLNGMASDFLFLDGQKLDIPTSGKFLNQLDEVIQEAQDFDIPLLIQTARAMAHILEKFILDAVDSKEDAFKQIESGISLMQQIADSFQNSGAYSGSIQDFLEAASAISGAPIPVEGSQAEDQPQPNALQSVDAKPEQPVLPPQEVEIQDESLLKDFISEGLEYIEEIEVNILNLEQEPDNKDYINTIFRPFHSMKGVASFLNLETIRDLAHNLENLLDDARNDQLQVTPPVIDAVLDGADALKMLIGQLKDRLAGLPAQALDLDLKALMARINRVRQNDQQIGKKLGEILMDEGAITPEILEEGLKAAKGDPPKKLGEALIGEGKVTPRQVSQALRKQTAQITDTSTIRVDTQKLDDMIDMVGELVITQSMIQQDIKNQLTVDRNLTRDIAQFFRITSGLQRLSTGLRMVPIKQTFQRMSRLVRDLAKSTGKQIAVEMEGEDTEIDRNMVDEIYNPLVHMIRNSVDHGIEPAAERIKQGKPEKGLIQLKAYHRGGNVVIEIVDDGKGLDRTKILKKAVKNGLIENDEGMSDQDVFRLILLPGLSTAEKITDVSGRGVGMDVVKQAVEKLRGKIEIESAPGKGTTLVTSFPLTMAIIDGMIVKIGPERYILPTSAIRQAFRPQESAYANVVGKGEIINVMGRLMPLVRLYELFNIRPERMVPWEAIVLVVDGESQSKCMMVDEIIGKTEVVIKNLGERLKNLRGVSGGAIMGDGQIGLILDPEGIFDLSET